MKIKRVKTKKKGLSFTVILISGIFASVLIFASVVTLRYIHDSFTPTVSSSERLLRRGKPREAMRVLNKSTAAKQNDSRTLLLRGKILFSILIEQLKQEKWGSYGVNPNNWISHPMAEEAEKCFLEAMEKLPDNIEVRQVLGNLYREQGRFGEAELVLRSALNLDENDAETYFALGLLYAESERFTTAEKTLLKAWELDKNSSKIAKNIAYFYRYYKEIPESSIVWFNRYFDLNPRRDTDINLARAELNNLLERYSEFDNRDPQSTQSGLNRGANRKFSPRFSR
ncbi:MAG: tetratricopeptide repeat protein [Chitinispirillales bacterium]|jgi:tetratricopeptide (TPR) repeat protein|nr:tetratricopeptide repeat protein [Chitinispirillales bacterium]